MYVCMSNPLGNSSLHMARDTDMCRLTTGIRSEKCIVRRFRRCAKVIECTYTNLDSLAYYTMVQPTARILETCTACYCTEYCRQL
jgi:hypothetical protein